MRKFTVIYEKNGRECRSPWFHSRERAAEALRTLTAKYGRAVIYTD